MTKLDVEIEILGDLAISAWKVIDDKATDVAAQILLDRRTFDPWMDAKDCGLELAIACLQTIIKRYEAGELGK